MYQYFHAQSDNDRFGFAMNRSTMMAYYYYSFVSKVGNLIFIVNIV